MISARNKAACSGWPRGVRAPGMRRPWAPAGRRAPGRHCRLTRSSARTQPTAWTATSRSKAWWPSSGRPPRRPAYRSASASVAPAPRRSARPARPPPAAQAWRWYRTTTMRPAHRRGARQPLASGFPRLAPPSAPCCTDAQIAPAGVHDPCPLTLSASGPRTCRSRKPVAVQPQRAADRPAGVSQRGHRSGRAFSTVGGRCIQNLTSGLQAQPCGRGPHRPTSWLMASQAAAITQPAPARRCSRRGHVR
jgi:hypothetical protein